MANVINDQIDDVVVQTEIMFREFQGARSKWIKQATEDNDFRHGAQWTEEQENDLKGKGMSPIVVNVIYPAVEQAKALLTTHKPRFSSTGREDSDTKTGKMFSDLLTYIWDYSLGNVELKAAIDSYYVKGMGAFFVYADPHADFGKGEVCFKHIPIDELFIDPNSKDIFCRDASDIILKKTMTREQVLRTWPEFGPKIESATPIAAPEVVVSGRYSETFDTITPLNMNVTRYDILDKYTKVKMPVIHVYDPMSGMEKVFNETDYKEFLQEPAVIMKQGGQTTYLTQEKDVDMALSKLEQFGNTYHLAQNPLGGQPQEMPGPALNDPNAIPNSETNLELTSMAFLVDQGVIVENQILQDRIQRTLIIGRIVHYQGLVFDNLSEFPIIPLMNRHMENPYPMSDVRVVKQLQQYVNKIRSLIVAHAASSTSVKLLLPKGAAKKEDLEREWGKVGTGVIEFEAELGQPVVAAPVALPNELYKNEADARKDIQEILGIYALMQGDAGQAPNTYKGTVALDEYGQRRIKSKKDDVEAFLNQVAKVLVQYIQFFYTEPKVIRLLRPNNSPKELQINTPIYDDVTGDVKYKINDVTVGQYDVVVVSGSMLPSNRWAQFEYYMQMYQQGLIDQIEVLKKSELVDVEGVLNRFSEIQRLQQELAAAQEEIKNLKGDLQTAQRESVQDRKRVEVEKFKSNLKGIESDGAAASTIFKARLNDEVKNARLENKAKNKGE